METWRLVGGAIVGVGGALLVLVAMAQARDSAVRGRRTRGEGRGARVARAGVIGAVVAGIALLLVLTVLPSFAVWAVAATMWLILLALITVG